MNVRLLILAAGAILLAAPQPSRAQETQPTIAGMYQLVTVDGHAIPFRPVHPGAPANAGPGPEVLASTMTVRPDGSFIMAMAYRMAGPDKVELFRAMPFSGSWKAEGSGWTAQWDGAGLTPLTMAGDTLVMNNEGMLFAYLKIGPRR